MDEKYKLIKPDAAADRIGLSASTLAKLRMKRAGPPWVALGRSVRYRVADLDAWVEAHTISTGPAA
ncbi:MAG: helix-turn-helix domain-containing protein [Paracoccaceae bacterium]|nr:helix-turn-helix domain-containing protein [Paracoccaceae bacterium]